MEFYEELSKRKAEMDAKLSTEEEQMLAAYRAARSSASVTEAPTVALLNPKPKPQQKKGNGSASKPAATIGEWLLLLASKNRPKFAGCFFSQCDLLGCHPQ